MSRENECPRSRTRAFTISELLVGLVIFASVVAIVISIYAMIGQMWKENLAMNELSLSANVAIESMIHGKSANTGLLAAKSISAPLAGSSANSVDYIDALDYSRRFYYSAGKIYAEDDSPIISNIDEAAIASNNIFSNIEDRTIRIVLPLKKSVGKKEIKLRVETKVSPRN